MGADESSAAESDQHELVVVADDAAPGPPERRPSRWRRRALTAGAVVVSLLAGGVACGAYYVNSVEFMDLRPLPATSTLYYSDGSVMARLGSVDRTELSSPDILSIVKDAAVAAQDPGFWSNTAGAITRSVVRQSADIRGDSMNARMRLGVLAWKLEDAYPRERILEYYLNATPFGRNAYGIEAAARVYFDKSASRRAPTERQLTVAETLVVLALVDQPWPDPEDPEGSPGFDPVLSAKARANSERRWREIRDAMMDAGSLDAAAAAALTYPSPRPASTGPEANGLSRPVGLVADHVLSELDQGAMPGAWNVVPDGGFEIHTTIDRRAQEALESMVDETVPGSVMHGQPANLQAAAVVVEPGTGRVLAYFGGHDGLGNDHAGIYYDAGGQGVGFGRYPPGGTFFVHTLAAALQAGISVRSSWPWLPHPQPGRSAGNMIRNTSICPSDPRGERNACSLVEATTSSLNVPYYDLTVAVAPFKVLAAARDAGIEYMWTDDRERQDLRNVTDLSTLTPEKFDFILGLGQYPVTVLDQANAMATYAAGRRSPAHFVRSVSRASGEVLSAEPTPSADPLPPALVADLTWALSQDPAAQVPGIHSAGKTGAWEYNQRTDVNAHTWMVGYTTELAMAVWVGNRADEQPLLDKAGAAIWGSGLPAQVYREFMSKAHQAMNLTPGTFPAPVFAGDENPRGSVPG